MIILDNVTVKFGKQIVLDKLSCEFEEGVLTCITGASGIGKTTLINAIASLVPLKDGKVLLPTKRKLGYIFQDPRLFPWMTALENVTCVCDDESRARKYLELFLEDGANKYPHELSGGMKQRVAIARALAYEPDILLLDEPFKGLDSETKAHTVNTVMKLILGKTAIMVTHDKDELALADRIYLADNAPISTLNKVKSGSLKTE